MTANANELANKILDQMKEMGWVTTKLLGRWVGVAASDHLGYRAVRRTLKRMAARGIVLRSGSSTWKLNVKTWTSSRPMSAADDPDNMIQRVTPQPEEPDVEEPEVREPSPDDEPAEVEGPAPGDGLTASGMTMDVVNNFTRLKNEIRGLRDYADKVSGHADVLDSRLDQVESAIGELSDSIKSVAELAKRSCRVIEVKRDGKVVAKLKNRVLPKWFDEALDLASCRMNILLVGPAGCGKSHAGKLLADCLKLRFGTISCTAGMSESHLLGRSVPDLTKGVNRFQTAEFLDVYEGGGLFLLDEIDAADPNLMLAVNSALANGYCNVPNRAKAPKAVKHGDFVCAATANTFGTGADRVYAGRNQLDEATLDRYRVGLIECDYDEAVEAAVCPDDGLRNRLQFVRASVSAAGLRRVVSTRFLQHSYVMKTRKDWTEERILGKLTAGWSADEKRRAGL